MLHIHDLSKSFIKDFMNLLWRDAIEEPETESVRPNNDANQCKLDI